MFVVLKMVKSETNFFARRKQLKKIRKNPAVVCKTEKGLPFYILEVLEGKNGFDGRLTAAKCGRYASRIVAPRNVCLPDDSGLKRFIPISVNANLLFNTALKTIANADLPAEKICITVTDRNAVTPPRICEILPFASTVRIITSHPERFAAAAENAYENHGASLVIRSSYSAVNRPEIIICCDGAVLSTMNDAAVFVTKRKTGGKIRFNCNGIELSDYHRELLPHDIDTVDFAGALTELCGSGEYKFSSFSEIEISCANCENPTASECLRCFISDEM